MPEESFCRRLGIIGHGPPHQSDHDIILGGRACFAGTRVPVRNLFDYLAAGHPLDEFLRQFPSVTREQAVAVLGMGSDAAGVRPIAVRA